MVEFINNIKEVDNVQKIKLTVKIVLKFSKNVEEESKCYSGCISSWILQFLISKQLIELYYDSVFKKYVKNTSEKMEGSESVFNFIDWLCYSSYEVNVIYGCWYT